MFRCFASLRVSILSGLHLDFAHPISKWWCVAALDAKLYTGLYACEHRPPKYLVVSCSASIAEAGLATSLGVTAFGIFLAMLSGPGVIDERQLAVIAAPVAKTAPWIRTFLLTARTDATAIIAQHQRCLATWMQLVDHVRHAQLRELLRTHDWSASCRIRRVVDKPVFLAGGLNVANLSDAMVAVQPYGLDVCSGLRTDGLLDAKSAPVDEQTPTVTVLFRRKRPLVADHIGLCHLIRTLRCSPSSSKIALCTPLFSSLGYRFISD
ncbi:MAG: hypothetical protein ING75_10285 [Rhodocyclaceae bacterium]|nr:hypothetical protein [Rhodocyclaceae bacterium]